VTEWIAQPCWAPPDTGWTYGIEDWCAAVEEVTDGTVQIDLLPVGSITGSDESLGACMEGAIDVWAGWASVYGGEIPEGYLAFGLASGCQSQEEAWEIMWGDPKYRVGDIVQEAFRNHNLHWAGWTCEGTNQAFGNFEVSKWEDFKGYKMRAGGPQATWLEAMGGIPVSLPWGDIYMSTKLGTVDGFLAPMSVVATCKFYEVVKYIIEPPWNLAQHQEQMVNLDSWNALEQWQRDAIEGMFKERYILSSWNMFEAIDLERQTMLDYGCEVSQMSDEEIERMTARVVEEIWPKVAALSPDTARGVEIYKQFLKDKGRL